MRPTFVAIAATTIVATTNPTFAATRHHHPTPTFASVRENQPTVSQPTRSYDSCAALSVERGAAPGQGNSSNPEALYKTFVQQCLAGQIPLGR